jgi:hypothetical protein
MKKEFLFQKGVPRVSGHTLQKFPFSIPEGYQVQMKVISA